jgi:hypothetical protein
MGMLNASVNMPKLRVGNRLLKNTSVTDTQDHPLKSA